MNVWVTVNIFNDVFKDVKLDADVASENLIKKIIKPKKKIFIKMDIEGYEFYALQGLKKSLKNYKIFILFEFSKKI